MESQLENPNSRFVNVLRIPIWNAPRIPTRTFVEFQLECSEISNSNVPKIPMRTFVEFQRECWMNIKPPVHTLYPDQVAPEASTGLLDWNGASTASLRTEVPIPQSAACQASRHPRTGPSARRPSPHMCVARPRCSSPRQSVARLRCPSCALHPRAHHARKHIAAQIPAPRAGVNKTHSSRCVPLARAPSLLAAVRNRLNTNLITDLNLFVIPESSNTPFTPLTP